MNNICSDPACPIILDSTCVFYSGANLIYTGVNTNDNLQIVLQKIDAKFRDAGLGYVFTNGVVQTAPGQPVKLGGVLVNNTTINSQGFTFGLSGTIESSAFITTGGTSSQFVKGDGSLDDGGIQRPGAYITALTGDGTASGPGSSVLTLATVFNAPATYGSSTRVPIITVNAKGLVTGLTTTLISVPSSSVVINGDVYGYGNTGTPFSLTLQDVLATPGVYGSASAIPVINVNSKGLITSISQVALPSSLGTVTSVSVTPGTGISASVTNPTTTPNITITNTAPDQVVTLSDGTGINVTGTYPNFTITATGTSGVSSVTASTPLASSGGTTPNITIQQANASQAGYLSSADWNTFYSKEPAITAGTTSEYWRGDKTWQTFPTIPAAQIQSDWNQTNNTLLDYIKNKPVIPTVTPSALTKVDDTNVTLTLGGSPSTALLAATSLTLGWTGTLADSRIASATTWNAKQNAITLTTTGTSGAATFASNILNIPQYTDQYTGTVTSVGLALPTPTNPAFSVAPGSSPVTSSGTLTVQANGAVSQYVRGDGSLANFPTNVGGGSSVSYFLNGSVNQGVISGNTYYEMSRTPNTGASANFTRTNGSGNGYIAEFITSVGDPALLNIPAGNWDFQLYFSCSSNGGSPTFYAELYKYNGGFTLISTGSASPEPLLTGTIKDVYTHTLAVPATTLSLTDRLAIRIYVTTSGKDITMYTQDSNLAEIHTTFSTGLAALNGLTAQVQSFANDTNVTITSSGSTHTLGWSGTLADARIASATNWNTAYTNRITSLTTTGSSGAATLLSNVLNIPTYTLAGLGGQTQLNGTGFVKASGTTISYDNSTYLTSIGTGTTNELTYWSGTNSIGSLSTVTYPSLTELSYVKGVTSAIQTQIGTKITDNSWVDYSATSTFVGWATPIPTKKLQYKVLGANTLLVQFQIEGTSNATNATFTLPNNASAWGTQYFMTSVIASAGVAFINASSNVVNFSLNTNPGGTNSFTASGAKNIRGQMIVNI